MKFIILTSMSAHNKLSNHYFPQLEEGRIQFKVYPNSLTSPSDGNLAYCIPMWRRWAEDNSSYDRLILTDAWDVLCYGTREEIEEILESISPSPMFAAERNCYPEPLLADRISGSTPWRFANGGMLTASPTALFDWCDRVEQHPQYNSSQLVQQWLNRRLAESDPIAQIDFNANLFYCMFLEHLGNELENLEGKPHNKLTNTYPPLVHFNGAWPWEPFLEMMNNDK